jgi:hypothetical protein
VGEDLHLEARVEFARPKLIQTAATIRTPDRQIVAAGEGKYVPMPQEQSQRVMQSFVPSDATKAAAGILMG